MMIRQISAILLLSISSLHAVVGQNETLDDDGNFTMYDLLVAQGNLQVFNASIHLASIVADNYDDMDRNWTVFAPTDDAMRALDRKFLTENYRKHTQYILSIHDRGDQLWTAARLAELVATNDSVKVGLEKPDNLYVEVMEDGSIELFNSASRAKVVESDLTADNGILHKIDSIFMPDRLTKDFVELAAGGFQGFETVNKYLQRDGLAEELTKDGLTIFAPTDFAISRIDNETLQMIENDSNASRAFVLYHVVDGVYPRRMLRDGINMTTLSGEVLYATRDDNRVYTVEGVGLSLITDQVCKNGIVHVIESALIPPSFSGLFNGGDDLNNDASIDDGDADDEDDNVANIPGDDAEDPTSDAVSSGIFHAICVLVSSVAMVVVY